MEIQFKAPVFITPLPRFEVENKTNILLGINGLKIDFLVKPVDYNNTGPEPSEVILQAFNNITLQFYKMNGYIDNSLIAAFDEILFKNGYWGKDIPEVKIPIYADSLIVSSNDFKYYIR